MKKIIKLTEKDLQKLVQRIIKENESDGLEWLQDLDISKGEKAYKKSWRHSESEWGVSLDDVYDLITDNGIAKLSILNDIADELYRQFETAYDSGRDYARDNECTCDYCCDDYIYYEDHREKVDEARTEGYDEGRDSGYEDGYQEGKDSRDDEIDELKSKIEELEERIADLESELENKEE